MLNTQKPEGAVRNDGLTLDLHSVFPTIQGEGPFTGQRAVFVRLAGCNLQCPGCDTEYTRGRRVEPIAHIVEEVTQAVGHHPTTGYLVVITGGEPLRQPIGPLVQCLLMLRFRVQIESNGMYEPDPALASLLLSCSTSILCLVVSPKTAKIHPANYMGATVFKYVLDALYVDTDGLPIYALGHEAGKGVARPRPGAPVYLTPYDDPDDPNCVATNVKAVVRSAMEHGYIAGIQLHKFLNLA